MLAAFAVVGGLLVVGVGFAALMFAARKWRAPGTSPKATLVVCLLLAFLPLATLIGAAGTEGEPLRYSGPAVAALGVLIGSLLAWRFITRNWVKGVLLALTGLVGHLVIGWPAIYCPFLPVLPGSSLAKLQRQYQAAHQAGPLLRRLGLSLPDGYTVQYVSKVSKPEEASPFARVYFIETHQAFDYYRFYDLSREHGAPLHQWVARGGFRPTDYVLGNHRYYVREPWAVAVPNDIETTWIYGTLTEQQPGYGVEFYYDNGNGYLHNAIPGWGHPGARLPAAAPPGPLAEKREAAQTPLNVGDKAPDFSYLGTDGATHTSAELKGKPRIILFWGETAPPCLEMLAWLKEVHKSYPAIEIVSLTMAKVHDPNYLQQQGYTWHIGSSMEAWKAYRASAFPATFYVSRDGLIERSLLGIEWQQHQQALAELINKQPQVLGSK